MVTVKEATDIIFQQRLDLDTEIIPLINSYSRILSEDIYTDRDLPPYDRICMDGIAISSQAYLNGQRNFRIEGMQAAGMPKKTLSDPSNSLEVATGAVLPENADTIVPYEWLKMNNGQAELIREIKPGANIHTKGTDRKKGELIVSANKQITFPEIGALASVGKSQIEVYKHPKVLILSTGDELVDIDSNPANHQIRKSNVHVIYHILKSMGITAKMDHIRDDAKNIISRFEGYFDEYDILILSGAVSKGKYDFIPPTFDKMGVKKLFHRIEQRPGKPMWFGKKSKTIIFAFPGNPVSSYVCCLRYFVPWLKENYHQPEFREFAQLEKDFQFKPALTCFLQVKLTAGKQGLLAMPVPGKGSGDFANLVNIDGFLELNADQTDFRKGERFPIIRFRN